MATNKKPAATSYKSVVKFNEMFLKCQVQNAGQHSTADWQINQEPRIYRYLDLTQKGNRRLI